MTKLLIIDDDPSYPKMLAAYFHGRLGYECVLADTGAAGAASAADNAPDAILLDLRLKDMTGFDVLQRMRGDARSAEIPVVVLTGESRAGDLLSAAVKNMSVSGFLQKSATLETVKAAVDRALGRI